MKGTVLPTKPKPPVNKKMPPKKERAKLATRYKRGETLIQLAASYKVSPETMRLWLVKDGVQMRRRGPKNKA